MAYASALARQSLIVRLLTRSILTTLEIPELSRSRRINSLELILVVQSEK